MTFEIKTITTKEILEKQPKFEKIFLNLFHENEINRWHQENGIKNIYFPNDCNSLRFKDFYFTNEENDGFQYPYFIEVRKNIDGVNLLFAFKETPRSAEKHGRERREEIVVKIEKNKITRIENFDYINQIRPNLINFYNIESLLDLNHKFEQNKLYQVKD